MKILVVAATLHEIVPFVKLNTNTDVLITGVGIPATVYHLTKKLLEEKYDAVIQAGIAGSFTKKLKSGDVVIVEKDVYADIGLMENNKFKTIFKMGLGDKNKFPFTKGWVINNSEILQSSLLPRVNAVTINMINDAKKNKKQLKNIFHADIETMEGAAFHYVCLQQSVPFLQMRSISNKVGERDKLKWNIKDAIENLNYELLKMIDLLKNL